MLRGEVPNFLCIAFLFHFDFINFIKIAWRKIYMREIKVLKSSYKDI